MAQQTATILGSITLKREKDDWEGRVTLSSWAGFQSCLGAYGGKNSAAPSTGEMHLRMGLQSAPSSEPHPNLVNALKAFIDHQDTIRDAMAAEIIYEVQRLQEEEGDDERFPDILDVKQLMTACGPSTLHVFAENENSPVFVGMEMGCDWDMEHGLGVITNQGRVFGVGQAEVAFSHPGEPLEPHPRDTRPPEVREFRRLYMKIANDRKPYTVTLESSIAPSILGELEQVYGPFLENGNQFSWLCGVEAVVLAEFLRARGINAKSSSQPLTVELFHRFYPSATDIDLALKVLAIARISYLRRAVRPQPGAWIYKHVPNNMTMYCTFDQVFPTWELIDQGDERAIRVTDAFRKFIVDFQEYSLEVSPPITLELFEGPVGEVYRPHLSTGGDKITGLALAESILVAEFLRRKGRTVTWTQSVEHNYLFLRRLVPKITEPLERVLWTIANARRWATIVNPVIELGACPANMFFMASLESVGYHVSDVIWETPTRQRGR